MASKYDATEFVDNDFQQNRSPYSNVASGLPPRAPTREEVDLKAVEAQQKLLELKKAQEELERQRSELEETRRRQAEFHTGRQEMLTHLERGIGLLEEGEFAARQEAEQTAKAVASLRDALGKVTALHEEQWSQEDFQRELTRALTTLENARMEWNSCRLKFPVLSGKPKAEPDSAASPATGVATLADLSLKQACKLGLALTWPLALVTLLALGAFMAVIFLR